MIARLGDRRRFAVEVGEWVNPLLRRVDLWAADQWLTCDDNLAFVWQFRMSVAATAAWVRSGGVPPAPFAGLSPADTHRRLLREGEYQRFSTLHWGPTTDNVSACLFRDGDHLTITLEFWREEHLLEHPEHVGTVLVAHVGVEEFAGILEELVTVLSDERSRPPDA